MAVAAKPRLSKLSLANNTSQINAKTAPKQAAHTSSTSTGSPHHLAMSLHQELQALFKRPDSHLEQSSCVTL
eukprot:CAMPEP_0115376588 /NCGR_PEP_ID=MMETSP0271-20121206/3054_1 /TAXON_ID=71861 /ORGANISM="Scrippsiella trochoidea, Strain CCMP3099" /LENGTH=71 /DNA_ID=CAMNT_0002799685 /DNA_START=13 /DNA_END=228 /DNA_ORIENTATION=+